MIDLFIAKTIVVNTIVLVVHVLLSLVDAELVFRVDAAESTPLCLVGATKQACTVTLNSRYRNNAHSLMSTDHTHKGGKKISLLFSV
jgi:hypothetical protein